MTTDLITLDLDQATAYAEELPNHAEQIELYAAAGLTRPQAFSLEAHAAKITTIGRRGILGMGLELIQAREEAQYGTWGPFLKRCALTERTAENYMSAARLVADKPEMISALPASGWYALGAPSADPEIVQEIITEIQEGAAPKQTVDQIKKRLNGGDGGAPASTRTPPADDLNHLPHDFKQAQARAAKLGISLSMSTSGRFTFVYDATRAVAGTAEQWPQALDLLKRLEIAALAPLPTQATLPDEEIAAAAPAPAPAPPLLTPLPPALPGLGASADTQARKLLVSKRMLLQAALHLVEEELAQSSGPLISFPAERAMEAARTFLGNQGLNGAAAMLAFSARVEEVTT